MLKRKKGTKIKREGGEMNSGSVIQQGWWEEWKAAKKNETWKH